MTGRNFFLSSTTFAFFRLIPASTKTAALASDCWHSSDFFVTVAPILAKLDRKQVLRVIYTKFVFWGRSVNKDDCMLISRHIFDFSVSAILVKFYRKHVLAPFTKFNGGVFMSNICLLRLRELKRNMYVFGWLVGCIEDLRRFSGISAITRLGSGR